MEHFGISMYTPCSSGSSMTSLGVGHWGKVLAEGANVVEDEGLNVHWVTAWCSAHRQMREYMCVVWNDTVRLKA